MNSKTETTASQAPETVGKASEHVALAADRVVGQAAEQAGEAMESARRYASEGLDRVEVAIRRNPLAATAIAAGIGFFFAALARR